MRVVSGVDEDTIALVGDGGGMRPRQRPGLAEEVAVGVADGDAPAGDVNGILGDDEAHRDRRCRRRICGSK